MFQSHGGSPFSRGLLPAHKGFLGLTSGGLVLLMASSIAVDSFSNSELITARKRSLGQGNIFTPVCYSVHRGVCLSACWDTTPPRTRHPPRADPLGTEPPPPREQQTHPLGPGTHQEHTLLGSRPPQEQTAPPWEQTPPPEQSILGDMVNERAVRILLECNLVRQFDKLI